MRRAHEHVQTGAVPFQDEKLCGCCCKEVSPDARQLHWPCSWDARPVHHLSHSHSSVITIFIGSMDDSCAGACRRTACIPWQTEGSLYTLQLGGCPAAFRESAMICPSAVAANTCMPPISSVLLNPRLFMQLINASMASRYCQDNVLMLSQGSIYVG